MVAALLEKRSILAADLAVAEDAVTCLRRQITALSETLKTFWHLEPGRDRMPAAVRHKRSKEGFRKDELTCRVLEKIRDAAEPVRSMDVARAIMVECLMDQGDQKLTVVFQHKVGSPAAPFPNPPRSAGHAATVTGDQPPAQCALPAC